ncbi:MAG TPA: VOC family protein [Candidatus Nitrosotalea sp.]|nr:VOC family protein [Candidatus Nitrosotalea sp.]
MQTKGLAYVMLGAADVDRSAAFYRERLGLTLSARFEDFAFLDAGTVTLALSGELARREGVEGREPLELVFSVESVTAAYDALKTTVSFDNEPRPVNDQNWAVNFSDPDGHSLSFYGPQ